MLTHTTATNDALDHDQPLDGQEAAEAAAFDRALEDYVAASDALTAALDSRAPAAEFWAALAAYRAARAAVMVWWRPSRLGEINATSARAVLADRLERAR